MTDNTTPAALLARWDAQQTAYIRHRADRFDALVRALVLHCGARPRVLDLACGPGSLTRQVRAALPEAEIVAVDKDPVLLALAEDVFADDGRITTRAADLDDPRWLDELGSFDAVVSSTALHWLTPTALVRLYFALTGALRPGGIFLNADHLLYDATSNPALRDLAAADDTDNQESSFAAGAEDWDAWWAAVTALPRYADQMAAREQCWADHTTPPVKVSLGFHLETLRNAGFTEVGTLWQYLDDYVIAGVR
ncbi:MAG: class I SAM-dependent methyltransferase [Propioniciclava sp.]